MSPRCPVDQAAQRYLLELLGFLGLRASLSAGDREKPAPRLAQTSLEAFFPLLNGGDSSAYHFVALWKWLCVAPCVVPGQ